MDFKSFIWDPVTKHGQIFWKQKISKSRGDCQWTQLNNKVGIAPFFMQGNKPQDVATVKNLPSKIEKKVKVH